MSGENKKEAIAALHREQILSAAEQLFSEKGFAQTTIDDISKAAAYSRRTIYVYYESKEDILHHIIAKGLLTLRHDMERALQTNSGFLTQFFAVCAAMKKYQTECPHSLKHVTAAKSNRLEAQTLSPTVAQILSLGTEVNTLFAGLIQSGKDEGMVRQEVEPTWIVYILWSGIASLLALVQTKGTYIAKAFSITEDDYLEYGLQQILNSILEVRMEWKNKQA